jgi:hypothetical protein
MSQESSKPTMDISPWPTGEGFQGAKAWWDYVLRHSEQDRLDFLILAALVSSEVRDLLLKHDLSLFEKFELSAKTIAHLSRIEAQTLEEFVQAMLR